MIGLLASTSFGSPGALENARTTVKEWVAAENALSREITEWKAEKVLLRDLIAVANARIERLETALAENKGAITATDERRAELLARSDELAAQEEKIAAFLVTLETGLRQLRARLPDLLQDELAALYQRLPADPDTTDAGLGERMQTVVGLLTAIRQFDGKITVSETTQTLPGREIKGAFQTVWLGLGQAYYLAPGDAGFGIPGPDGWEWHSRPELESRIRESISLVERSANVPKMIDLPIRLSEGGRR